MKLGTKSFWFSTVPNAFRPHFPLQHIDYMRCDYSMDPCKASKNCIDNLDMSANFTKLMKQRKH